MNEAGSRLDALYALMQASHMNGWVGGGQVKGIATQNFEAILQHTNLKPNDKVLDFGCGIGRTTAPVADYCSSGEVVGIDIMYDTIQFCQSKLRPVFKNTKFHHLLASNPLYDDHGPRNAATDQPALDSISLDYLRDTYKTHFDVITNLSVFTHFTPKMAEAYLELFDTITKPAGVVFMTAFLDMPWNPPTQRLRAEDGGFRDCAPTLPLNFALFGLERLADIAFKTGWRIVRIILGVRDMHIPLRLRPGMHGHDVLVLTKRPVLPAGFTAEGYRAANPNLNFEIINPEKHYLRSGFFEDRK